MASANGRSKRWARILYTLAMDGPLNPYKTWAKLVKEELATQPTIRGDLEELLKMGRVKNVDTDRKARGGRPSIRYDLTLPGLATVIANLEDNESGHRLLDYLAKKYRAMMPLVFDVWPAILEGGVGDVAFRRLQEICISVLEAGLVSKDSLDLPNYKVLENFFAPDTYLEETRDDRRRWFQGIRRDKTLRERMRTALHDRIRYLEDCQKGWASAIQKANQILEVLSEKDGSG